MKVYVKDEGHRIIIPVPDWLLFSRLSMKIFLWSLRRTDDLPEGLNDENVGRLFSEVRRMVKKYGHWELVHIESGNGEEVVSIKM